MLDADRSGHLLPVGHMLEAVHRSAGRRVDTVNTELFLAGWFAATTIEGAPWRSNFPSTN